MRTLVDIAIILAFSLLLLAASMHYAYASSGLHPNGPRQGTHRTHNKAPAYNNSRWSNNYGSSRWTNNNYGSGRGNWGLHPSGPRQGAYHGASRTGKKDSGRQYRDALDRTYDYRPSSSALQRLYPPPAN